MRSITDGADSPTCSPIFASGSLQFSCSSARIWQVDVVEFGFVLFA